MSVAPKLRPGMGKLNMSQEELLNAAMGGGCDKRVYTVVKSHVVRNPNCGAQDVYPVELSMAAFSLTRGVIETYNTLIDPGSLPSGLAFEAKVLAEETGLPRLGMGPKTGFSAAHADYKTIALSVRNFIYKYLSLQSGRFPRKVLFLMPQDLRDVCGTFKWLAENSRDDNVKQQLSNLDFVDLSKLYFRLAVYVNKIKPYYTSPMVQLQMIGLAEKQLNTSDIHSFRFEITCPYHCDVASHKMDTCAKNYVLKRVFVIIEEFVDILGFEKLDGHSILRYNMKRQ